MTDNLNFTDENKPALTPMLNVLTILTFIGSGIGILFSVAYPMIMKFFKSMMEKAVASGQEMSAKQLADIEKGRHAMAIAEANITPIIITGIIGCILCIAGAMMMRKLKKDGYWLYISGELLPLITSFVLMGTAQFTGAMSYIFALGLPLLFVVLYSMQRKYLVN